jgi:1-acyl-sn-glycerol-3-phosphate acyltransferase
MRPPPRWLRRILLAPAVVLLTLLLVGSLPIWLLLAGAAAPLVPGRLRPLRVFWLGLVYLVLETAALAAMFGLWVGSGFGWRIRAPGFQRAHYRLTAWYLRMLFWQAQWVLRLTITVTGPDPDAIAPGRPLVVCCRHAGPGDSFILTHALVNLYSREPRIVLKDTLQWDPAIDVMLNRLPSRFVVPGSGPSGEVAAEVGALAAGLDHNDAFVIFPEGGNFTPARRERAIARLRALGLHRLADRAAAMRHVLAPRSAGLLAALDVAPEADVVWVAHTGLDRLLTVADAWRELPMDKTITMRWWPVPAAEVPVGRDARVEWLYDWWHRIDTWIGTQAARRG